VATATHCAHVWIVILLLDLLRMVLPRIKPPTKIPAADDTPMAETFDCIG
jgi:hypothetical protein